MRTQLRLFGPAGDDVSPPAPGPILVASSAGTARRQFRLPMDLARWVRDEAEARDLPPDAVVALAVIALRDGTVWGGGRDR